MDRVSPFTEAAGPRMRPSDGKALVALFDGQCGVCTRSAAWVGQRDQASAVERLDLRDPVVSARFPAFEPEKVRESLHVLDAGGELWVGVEAIARVLAVLPRWQFVARGILIPGLRGAAGAVYRAFASRRLWFNRFFPLADKGCDGSCTHGPVKSASGARKAPTFIDGRGFLGPPGSGAA